MYNFLKNKLIEKNIPFKENAKNLIIQCPLCYYKDGKVKLKFYIDKDKYIFHCFRCGIKGSLIKLSKILEQYYQIDLTPFLSFSFFENSISNSNFFSSTLEEINTEFTIKLINGLRKNNKILRKTIKELKENIDKNVVKQIYGYLLSRNIPPMMLKRYPYFISSNVNSKLYGRFGIFTFFYTSYEARSIFNQKPKYLKPTNSLNVSDYIFLTPFNQKTGTFSLEQKLIYQNPESYLNKSFNFDKLYIVEGLFDALKLNLYMNLPVISLGGWNSYKNSLVFLKLVESLTKEFNINKLIFVFDKDIDEKKCLKVADTILPYKSYFQNINQFEFKRLNIGEYKDFGEVESIEDLKYILSKL